MRMQPCDAREPIEPGSPVPWMPTPLTMPIQRALSGFCAEPPATVSLRSAPAHGLFGAVHGGLTALLAIEKRPVGRRVGRLADGDAVGLDELAGA